MFSATRRRARAMDIRSYYDIKSKCSEKGDGWVDLGRIMWRVRDDFGTTTTSDSWSSVRA
jgi:hypothetical protein